MKAKAQNPLTALFSFIGNRKSKMTCSVILAVLGEICGTNFWVKGKTLIVVAHRLSTICSAQQILVVDSGTIIGRGTQEELLENCPAYRKMWEQHTGAQDIAWEGVNEHV